MTRKTETKDKKQKKLLQGVYKRKNSWYGLLFKKQYLEQTAYNLGFCDENKLSLETLININVNIYSYIKC